MVANLDADAAQNKPLAEKYGVQSYPTIKFFAKGKKGKPHIPALHSAADIPMPRRTY